MGKYRLAGSSIPKKTFSIHTSLPNSELFRGMKLPVRIARLLIPVFADFASQPFLIPKSL